MELIDLVSELLYKHNCVIIPDFGGFVANFKSTEFEEKRLLLSPSRKKVAFNQSLKENDGLLINSLVKRKFISYEQAEKEVNLFSKFLNDRLIQYKNYEFKNIGSFYLNKEDKLIFVAYEGLNFYKKSYGLQDVKVKRLSSAPLTSNVAELRPREVATIVPLEIKKRKRWLHLPQVAASLAILTVVGLVLWQLLDQGTTPSDISESETSLAHETSEQASLIPEITADTEEYSNENVETPSPIVDAIESELQPLMEEVTSELEANGTIPTSKINTQPKVQSSTIEEVESIIEDQIAVNKRADLDAMYKRLMQKDLVYYVAIKNYTSDSEVKKLIQKFSAKQYTTFSLPEMDGSSHLCLEKFNDKGNANAYLALVKRYDDRSAYLIEREE